MIWNEVNSSQVGSSQVILSEAISNAIMSNEVTKRTNWKCRFANEVIWSEVRERTHITGVKAHLITVITASGGL